MLAYVYLKLNYDPNFFGNGMGNFTFDVEGNDRIYDPRTLTTGYSQNPALCIAHYLTDTSYGLGASYDDLDLTT